MEVQLNSSGVNRRTFLRRAGAVSATALAAATYHTTSPHSSVSARPLGMDREQPKRWLFWDLWKLDYWDNLELVQGEPSFQADASYVDPEESARGVNFPVVFRDTESKRWRMLYSVRYRPYTVLPIFGHAETGRDFRANLWPCGRPNCG